MTGREKIRMKLNFVDCRMEVFFKERHYLLSRANLMADINTDKDMDIGAQYRWLWWYDDWQWREAQGKG